MLLRRLSSHLRRYHSSSATTSIPLPLDPDTVLRTLSLYSNDWQSALEFFHYASSPPSNFHHTPSTLSSTIDILGKHREFDRSRSLISFFASSFSSPSHLLPSFRSLFNRLAAAHLVSDVLGAFDLAENLGLRDCTTFHLMIDALCDHGHVSEAENLCLRSESPPFPSLFPPDTKTYNMLLRGWVKLRAFGRCRDFWQEMDRDGIEKDVHSYSIYMSALSKGGKPWKALKLFKEMQRKNIEPDIVAYNTVIHATGHSKGVDSSIQLYQEMVEAGVEPNTATLNTIVKLFCVEGRFKEAYCIVSRMRRKHRCQPDVLTYHCFFQYLTRPQEIINLFEQMVQAGCRPRMDTYIILIKKFGRWGFMKPVFDIWSKMEKHGCSPDASAYNAIINALLQNGMVDMAREYDKEMVTKGLSAKPIIQSNGANELNPLS
ncbi:Pentatricopeptide repeat-containing protein [Rhynchospora pubera]|uniref:Pentatricopeptide repeat-containing protein n=1 Tax=Rhynchospora pubera TaxID=906938 RepID=A0AAV8CV32_9POAL|nr:Pentatricopeptide repeat-containing protein [Rhynchospora pubera]